MSQPLSKGAAASPAKTVAKDKRTPSETSGVTAPVMLGLCVNCDLRKECKLPKAEAGVWFCEEYQ